MEALKERAVQAWSLILLILAWAALAYTLDTKALPLPRQVAVEFWTLVIEGEALAPLTSTLYSTALGFALGFLAGLAYGIATYLWPRFGEITSGLFNVTLYVPTLVVIFLGLIMLGPSNRLAVVLISGLVIFPNIGVYIRDSLGDLEPDVQEMATSFKVGVLQRVRDVYMPYLIPPMLAAGRIGFSIAWKVTFLAEVFGFPEGLGWHVKIAYRGYDMIGLLAWLVIFIVALLIIEQMTRVLERVVVKW